MSAGTWSKLADVAARETNRVEVIHDSASPTQRYYRLVTPYQEWGEMAPIVIDVSRSN